MSSNLNKRFEELGPLARIELPRFSAISFGLECRFPIIESDGLTVAVLLFDNSREHIGLLLYPSKNSIQAGPLPKEVL